MRVVVTNDDGISALGIAALAAAIASTGHEVTVVAPVAQCSGAGTSLGSELDGSSHTVKETQLAGLPDVPAIAVDGTPAFISLAISAGWLGLEPEVVVSGVNGGHNVGRLTLFSGTLAAALTAALHHLPAIAISAPRGRASAAAQSLAAVFPDLVRRLQPGQVWNVNYPDVDDLARPDWRLATLAEINLHEVTLAPSDGAVGVALGTDRRSSDPDSDLSLLAQGFITATPVSSDLAVSGAQYPVFLADSTQNDVRV